jgi:hypothetical protein
LNAELASASRLSPSTLAMGFDIKMTWQREEPAPEQRNERLAAAILDRFPGLQRFPLDHDLVAKTIGVPRQDVLQHWCQIEIDDRQEKLFGAIVTLWLWGVGIELPSVPKVSCADVLSQLEPFFELLESHGLAMAEGVNLLESYEAQRRRVEHVGRLLQRPARPR